MRFFIIILFCLVSGHIIGQPKIDLRTQSKLYNSSGLSLVVGRGTAVDTSLPAAALQSLRTNATNTNFEWFTPGSGSVTSVGTSTGLTGGPITTTGTISLDTASSVVLSRQRAANEYSTIGSVALKLNISDTAAMLSNYLQTGVAASTYAPISIDGTVTSVATGLGLSGGTITTTGTILVDTADASILSRQRAANTYAPISVVGSVTSVGSGYGLSGGTITTTGTLLVDSACATCPASKTRLTNTLGDYVNALSAIGASANANGATITGSTLNLQPASASFGGVVTTGTQTMAGAKTFSSTVTGSASPAFTIGTYGAGIRGTASGNTTWLQLEQASGNPIAIWLGNTTLDYSILELMDPGGTLNTNNFEFSCLGGGYATNGLLAANSLLAWTRSGLTNGYRMGTQSGPVILFTGGFATTNERVRILNTGEMAVSGTATPLTTPTAHLHIAAGAAGAGKAPLKFSSGTDLTTPEAGAMEFDGTNLHFSPSTTRYDLAMYLAGSAALNFGSTAAQSSADLTITVTGAADGDPVILGVPNAATLTNSAFTAWVSAANTVTVRYNNYSSGAQDPANATFKVKVIKN